ETFIHLDNQSQKKVVLMVMDYIVASESIYPDKEPYLNTTNRKTVKALQTLWNQIIISSAYAQKEQFETNQLCLYGGWLSVIVSQNGKEVCTHPMNIQKNLKSIKDAGAKKR